MSELLYARVAEPSELRRELLVSTKKLIEALRSFEQYKLVRQEKQTLSGEVKDLSDEIASSVRKLKTHFPKTEIKLKKEVKKPEPKPEPKVEAPKKQQKGKLQILEDELGKIEGKLSALE